MFLYQTVVFITHGKTKKAHIINTYLKYRPQHAVINLNYQMGHILYHIFKSILSILKKKTSSNHPSNLTINQ